MKKLIPLLLWVIATAAMAQDKTFTVSGTVISSADEEKLAGAAVSVKNTSQGMITNTDGTFSLELPAGKYTLLVSYIGYATTEVQITVPLESHLDIRLREDLLTLKQVEIVSTGYQELPKERATGSFIQVDTELLNRRAGNNILDRLEDITPGLVFNRDIEGQENNISIRGTSTIFADARPLIIIDNFPYDGPMDNINPNDIESITVLKDAAAASIWGARAGNGVIVIKTKSGSVGKKPQISFSSYVSVREKPDLFYAPQMQISDFIDLEQDFYEMGLYDSQVDSRNKTELSPVVETLIALDNGSISEQQANTLIAAYRSNDLRKETTDLFYRNQVQQQYALNFSGGNKIHRYFFSAGYDKSAASLKGNGQSRLTLHAKNDWHLLKNKLKISGAMYYARSVDHTETAAPPSTLAPYTRLTDDAGNPLPVIRTYSQRFVEQAEANGLLNWQLFPVTEIGMYDHVGQQQDIRLNTALAYEIVHGLKAEAYYQYWNNRQTLSQHYPVESYFTRDLINTFTQTADDGSLEKAVPEGGILDLNEGTSYSHTLRAQLRFDRSWNAIHRINAVAGYELKDFQSVSNSVRYYGYDDELGLSQPVDFTTRYRRYHNNFLAYIPDGFGHTGLIDRFISYYANASYTFLDKYTVSASGRKDASNLFGVDTNQKGVPLWSAGLSWQISEEGFYNVDWLPYLKLRSTYGYNGNIDKSVTAYTTALYRDGSGNYLSGLPFAQISRPANPELRWEKIRITNLGLDFESKKGEVSGSIEGYFKRGLDLIGDAPYPSSTGVFRFRGNHASTKTTGLDVALSTVNINKGLKWTTDFFYSHVKEEVTSYEMESAASTYIDYGKGTSGVFGTPYEGRPLYGIYSHRFAGLNPDTGAPQGYVDGEISEDYREILYNSEPEDLQYHGPGRPTSFGALRNTFKWRNFSLSANISFRLGYYYKRNSIDYEELMDGQIGHTDYYLRWQEPGDEQHTNIPSMPPSPDRNRNSFYYYSAALVEKGDHIRLQDIRLGYTIKKEKIPTLPFPRLEFYAYLNNIGLLWKASDYALDPDYRTSRPLRSITIGIRADL